MRGRLIPFGYGHKEAEDVLYHLMTLPKSLLVDIRKTPYSQGYAYWRYYHLKTFWQQKYMWMRELGNELHNSSESGIGLTDPDRGVTRLMNGLAQGYTIILMCGCKHYSRCHRKRVVELVQQQLPDVEVVQAAHATYWSRCLCCGKWYPRQVPPWLYCEHCAQERTSSFQYCWINLPTHWDEPMPLEVPMSIWVR